MIGQMTAWLTTYSWVAHLAWILVFYVLAWLVHRLAWRLAGRIVQLSGLASRVHRPGLERQTTLRSLIASTISFVAFAAATLASLSLFVSVNTLIWMIGLFSAAFGLGARPVSCILAPQLVRALAGDQRDRRYWPTDRVDPAD